MRRTVAVLALASLTAACTATPKVEIGAVSTTLATLDGHKPGDAASGASALVAAASLRDPPAKHVPPPLKVLCDAPSLMYLVGRRHTEIPVPADLSRRRVSCTTCTPPSDYQPYRTDIVFDVRTGLITDVSCG
ncbi:MAG TPA: hypothetical protein VHY34_03420 [Caulobacteraceae bacterium]|nr:hypothetical protein [Caulobacteraceae bacterium]